MKYFNGKPKEGDIVEVGKDGYGSVVGRYEKDSLKHKDAFQRKVWLEWTGGEYRSPDFIRVVERTTKEKG